MGERIAVAMSGGVDSSVAAWLLQREGHELMGVTLRLFDRETPEGTCGASDDLADARAVAERLGMKVTGQFVKTVYGKEIPHLIYSREKNEGRLRNE